MANWDTIKGQWNQLKGKARTQWGKITDDEWDQIAGHRDQLIGKLQEKYGWTKEKAEQEADSYFDQHTNH
ncbi:MAG: CsbD family protein [Chloroflexi bacterium AL-W]|nr:CsbD family protein [Chloroflexi bacterium AL-N1]NOK68089.1 CsbD family protein [Chloroflexi bacterium AL-N10]NOK73429.1 CsbD family protein [Chloroflexi bacterium AL-N5]NOK83343.1 CsbD family protein [Chloroflexi bacterium AL-W]NOK87760.1 CsbD family protein [Chloroflexi bacterium AL-N15]